LLAPKLLAKHGLAVRILTVEAKAMLAWIDRNERGVVHDGLWFRMS
jgi:hypothetical protein